MDKYVFGGVGGMCGVLVTHPIDTIKTNFQNGTAIRPTQLYKGLVPPMLGVAVEKALVFGTFHAVRNQFINKDSNLAISIAGAASGLCASIIVTPCERLKIMAQTNKSANFKINAAIIPELYRGITATFSREVPGFAIYFLTYENLKRNQSGSEKTINKKDTFLFGGFAGALSWLFIYPQDLIKTRIQASGTVGTIGTVGTKGMTNSGFCNVANMIYKEGGIKAFYKGFSLALARAIPLHACTFLVVEMLTDRYSN